MHLKYPEAQNNKNQIPRGSITEIKILAELDDTSENNLFVLYSPTFFTQTTISSCIYLFPKELFETALHRSFFLCFIQRVCVRYCFPLCLFSKYKIRFGICSIKGKFPKRICALVVKPFPPFRTQEG